MVRLLAVVFALSTGPAPAQTPDFAGAWLMDFAASDDRYAFHGHRLVITQSHDLVHIECFFTDRGGKVHHYPWDLRIGRFGPRRGGDHSQAPIVKAAWDGRKLMMIKAPGQGNSALWMLALDDANTLVIETISMRGLSERMLKESAIPREYGRRRFVFRRADGT